MMEELGYLAIRSGDRGEWMVLSTLSCSMDEALKKARMDEKVLPNYFEKHPLVRIAPVRIVEMNQAEMVDMIDRIRKQDERRR